MSDVERQREEGFSLVWPILAFVFGAACDVLASAGKFDALVQLSLLPVTLIGFVTAIVWVFALIYNAYHDRRRRVLSALAAVPAALLAMPGLWSNFDLASDVRLIVNYAEYDRQIATLPDAVGRRQTAWNWGGNTTAITGGDLYWLVYDETDSLPVKLRSGDPWPDADHPRFSPDRLEPKAMRLWGHFYLIDETVR